MQEVDWLTFRGVLDRGDGEAGREFLWKPEETLRFGAWLGLTKSKLGL